MEKLRDLFPANRVAALVGFLTSLGIALTTLSGSWGDEKVTKSVGTAVGVIGAVVVVLKFLGGSQNWDTLMHLDDSTPSTGLPSTHPDSPEWDGPPPPSDEIAVEEDDVFVTDDEATPGDPQAER